MESSGQRRFGILCVLVYVVLSWVVRFDTRRGEQNASLAYPLDTFSMYAVVPEEYMSHLLIRDARGEVHRVTAFRAFDCAEPVTGSAAACADERGIEYHYDDLVRYIQGHSGGGEQDVALISRTWRIRAGAAPERTADCVIAHCRVSP
jgi:hypothetical protein